MNSPADSFYFKTRDLDSLLNYFRIADGATGPEVTATGGINGTCYVCQRPDTEFRVDGAPGADEINWRETVVCPGCGLTNRWRSSLHLFEELLRPGPDDHIYITEAITPLFQALSQRYSNIIGSEFIAGVPSGAMVDTPAGPVRNEDVTRLSFEDASLHALLSFDVLEHVPDYRAALRESSRVLTRGGKLLLSAPFVFGESTRIRATVNENGDIEHLLDPVYHGDPLSEEGVLCYQEFGMDLLQDFEAAGFDDSFAVCFASRDWAYICPQVMFMVIKG
jgi:SAM-dependent methyltransferase